MSDQLGDRLDHVLRTRLPWRTTDLTECGRDPQRYPSITLDDYLARRRKHGDRRTAFTVCQTCESRLAYTLRHGRPVEGDGATLVEILDREIQRVRYDTDSQLARELTAIAALIGAHRDEYDATLAGLDNIPHLDQVRARRKARR